MNSSESIHVRSFREFIQRRLPEALGKVIPLTDYKADWTGDGKGGVTFYVGDNGPRITFSELPFPRADGSFVCGSGRAVMMTASSNNLEEAEIKAVGEQLMDEIAPRLVAPPNGDAYDEATLRAWFPLDQWLEDILLGAAIPTSNWLDVVNPISRATHLRRIMVLGEGQVVTDPELGAVGGDVSFHPSQIGRVDPLETPEGPRTGRILTLARGAEVRNGKIIPAPDHAENTLGVSNSLTPLLCHNDPMRQFQGANMIRQALVQDDPEPPLVRSGLEPEDGSAFLGRNLLTAFLHWKGMTYEDAIVVSESAAKRIASAPWVAEVGDKLSNRHGAKGVIGAVLPDDEMPHLPDGRPVDLIIDAMSVYGRLNFGQVLEAALGLVAQARGEAITMAPFRRTTPEELHALLREAGLPESGQFVLRDGKEGAELDEPTTVGYVYWYRLVYEVRSRIRTSAPGWQEGTAYRPGQRAGAMEIAALRAVDAYENILEACSTRVLTAEEAKAFVEQHHGGFVDAHRPPPSPAFRRVQQALRAGGIAMEYDDGKVRFGWMEGEGLPLAEPVEHPWRPGRQLTRAHGLDQHIDPQQLAIQMTARPAFAAALADPANRPYARVIAANERLAEALQSGAPDTTQASLRAALRKAVSELLEAAAEDCQVQFGERGQFTARSVLAPGYDLRVDQIGLPGDIAYPLFAPLIADQIGAPWVQDRFTRAKQLIDVLMRESVVIVNRAPTLEVTSITAFSPVMVPGRSILLHPLCCRLFNGDYDGDMAAVWLPITKMAQAEAKEKLTVVGHLRRDPSVVVGHLTPAGGILMGLAYALDFPEGRAEFAALWPAGTEAPAGPLRRDLLVARLRAALDTVGPEALLALLDGLYHMGIKWATRSGASFSPFVGEALKLPAPPAARYAASWHQYAGIVEAEIEAQAGADPTLRAPLRAIHSGARGSLRHLRATIGPWAGDSPYGVGAVTHGFRDGLEPEEYWIVTERMRRRLQEVDREVVTTALAVRATAAAETAPADASVLRRAMASRDPAAVFAEAAERGETDPLTDPDVRLWLGLRPE